MRRNALVLVFGALAVLPLHVGSASQLIGAPFSGVTDFATGFQTCGAPVSGPTGLLFDSEHFYATTYCTGKLYRFSLSGGPVASAQLVVTNGLNLGLAISDGAYFGVSDGTSGGSAAAGVWRFNPDTLQLISGSKIPFPTSPTIVRPRSIAEDPASSDLIASTSAGVYRIKTPLGPSPSVARISADTSDYDGIAVTQDGSEIYGAVKATSSVMRFLAAGGTGTPMVLDKTPDGIAIMPPNRTVDGEDLSNNVFVNTVEGTVERIDTNHANQITTVVSNGSRGDFSLVDPSGCLYITQSDKVQRLAPCLFGPHPAKSARLSTDALILDAGVPGGLQAGLPPRMRARLVASANSAPIPGAVIEFSVGGNVVCSRTTNTDGIAVCDDIGPVVSATAALGYVASFSETAEWLGAQTSAPLLRLNGSPVPQ